jgi:hypothetical protein
VGRVASCDAALPRRRSSRQLSVRARVSRGAGGDGGGEAGDRARDEDEPDTVAPARLDRSMDAWIDGSMDG